MYTSHTLLLVANWLYVYIVISKFVKALKCDNLKGKKLKVNTFITKKIHQSIFSLT